MKITKKSAEKWKENFLSFYYSTNPEQQKKAIILLKRHKPQYLYQYRRGMYDKTNNRNYDLDNLRNSIMRLSSPALFNDPYDCSFMINIDTLYDHYTKLTQTPMSKHDLLFHMECDENLKQTRNNFRRQLHIGCLTERNNSIVMWSHYANSHAGFCIEYSYDSLQKKDLQIFPVIYTNKMHNLVSSVFSRKINDAKKSMLEKSIEWKYENEWRIIRASLEPKDYQEVSMPLPNAIYIGCHAPENLQDDLISLCKEKDISLYQMMLKKDKFELTYVLI